MVALFFFSFYFVCSSRGKRTAEGGHGYKMESDLICLLQVITGKIRYLTRDVTFLHLFPFSLYIRGKVGFESSRMVLVYRIKLDLTNRVGNKKKFQRNRSYIQVKGCGRMIG